MAINEFDQAASEYSGQSRSIASSNPFDDAVNEYADQQENALKGSLTQAIKKNPDQAARVVELSKKTGIDADLVERKFDDIQRDQKLADDRWGRAIKNSPNLKEWLAEDPNNAAVSHDDVESLGYLEGQFQGLKRVYKNYKAQYKQGKVVLDSGELGWRALLGEDNPDIQMAKEEIKFRSQQAQKELDAANIDDAFGSSYMNLFGAAINTAPIMGSTIASGVQGGGVGAGVGAAGGAAIGAVLPLPGASAAMAKAGASLLGGIGFRVGSAINTIKMEAGNAYLDYENITDENGVKIDKETARGAALIAGTMNGLLEFVSFSTQAKNLPGLRQLSSRGVKDLIKSQTGRQLIKTYSKNLVESAATEGFTEFLQSLITSRGQQILELQKSGRLDNASGPEILGAVFSSEGVAEALQEGVAGAKSSIGMSIAGVSVTAGKDIKRVRDAQNTAQALTNIAKGVKDSKLEQRLPRESQELIKRMVKDSPAETAYVDVQALNKFFQSKQDENGNPVNPREIVERLLGDGKQYDEAMQSGALLEIPTERLAKAVASQYGDFFISEAKFDPTAMNAREAEEFIKKTEAEEKEAQKTGKKEPVSEFETKIREGLLAAGRKQEEIDLVAPMTARILKNIDPENASRILGRYGVRIMTPEQRADMGRVVPDAAQTQGFNQKILEQIKFDVEQAYSEKGALLQDGEGNVTGRVGTQLVGQDYLRGQGVSRAELIKAINKVIEGKTLTEKQNKILKRVYSASPYLKQEGIAVAGEEPFLQSAANKPSSLVVVSGRDDATVKSRKELDEYSRSTFRNLSVKNESLGGNIDIPKTGIEKTLNANISSDVLTAAFEKLPELLANAYLDRSEPDSQKRKQIVANHILYAPISFKGKIHAVKLTVREVREGKGSKNKFYLEKISEEANPARISEDTAIEGSESVRPVDGAGSISITEFESLLNRERLRDPLFQSSSSQVTETKEFKEWFGKSKVVDENGKPLVVYHGTTADFSVFKKGSKRSDWGDGRFGSGIYFTSDPAYAENYAHNDATRLKPGQGFYDGANLMPVYLKITNPFDVKSGGFDTKLAAIIGKSLNKDDAKFLKKIQDNYNFLEFIREKVSPEKFTEALKSLGYDGVKEDDLYSAFEPTQVKSAIGNDGSFDPNNPNILFQGQADPRGMIEFTVDGAVITLNPRADFSTFMHESAHLYLEVMRDLVDRGVATDAIKKDFEEIRNWMGLKPGEKLETKHHEMFAEAFEGYLISGKAPIKSLREAFYRFRRWMLGVYTEIRKRKELETLVSPEIRAVFDRMLIGDEQVEQVQSEQGLKPLFDNPRSIGMNEEQASRYEKKWFEAERATTERMTAKLVDQVKRQETREWNAERDAIRDELAKEVDSRPEQIANAHLRYGKMPDGSPLPEGIEQVKISKKSIMDRYGEAVLKKVQRPPYIYSVEGGIDVEDAAVMFGFDSGEQLINKLESVVDRDQELDTLADAEMKSRYGDIIEDGTVTEEAYNAIHNDFRAEAMEAEIRHLASQEFATFKGLARRIAKPIPSMSEVKQAAKRIIGEKKLRDIKPILYKNAEAKAGREAMELFLKGDIQGAFDAKEKQRLNHELYRAAIESQEFGEKLYKYARKFTKTEKRQQIGKADYLDQLDSILGRFEFARVPLKALDDRKKLLSDWIKEKEASGETNLESLDIPEFILKETNRVNYKELKVIELEGLYDTLKQINHIAIQTEKAQAQERAILRAQIKEELIKSIQDNVPAKAPESFTKSGETKKMSFKKFLRLADVSLIKMEQLFNFFDKDNIDGAWHKFVWNPVSKAQNREYEYTAKVTAKLAAALEKMPKEVRKRLDNVITVPGVPTERRLTRRDAIGVLLNTGTESNYDKLKRGMGWSDETIQRIIDQMEPDEIKVAETIWEALREMWPDVAKLQKEMTGLEPEKLAERKVLVKTANDTLLGYKEIQGGYYPMIYDSRDSVQGEIQLAGKIGELTGPKYVKAGTDKSHTKERTRFAAPVDLDIDRVVGHMAGVIKDLTHRKWVLEMNWILSDKEIINSIKETMGPEYVTRMREWVKDVIQDKNATNDQSIKAYKGLVSRVRQNLVFASEAFKSSVMIAQISGIGASVEVLGGKKGGGAKWMHLGLSKMLQNPRATYRWVTEKSGEMALRMETKDANLREIINDIRGKTDLISEAKQFGMKGIGYADLMVSLPTWIGGYEKALSEGKSEESAIMAGDAAVRLSQGAGAAKDKSAVMSTSNEFLKIVTLFYTPFSALYSRLRSIGFDAREIGDAPTVAARLFWAVLIPSILGELLAGRSPDPEDEPEEWAKWFLKTAGTYPFMSIPVVRDIVNGSVSDYGYTVSPLAQVGEKTAKVGSDVWSMIEKGVDPNKEVSEEDIQKLAKDTYKASSYWFGIPTRQLEITGSYMIDLVDGTEEPASVGEFMRNVTTGKPKK